MAKPMRIAATRSPQASQMRRERHGMTISSGRIERSSFVHFIIMDGEIVRPSVAFRKAPLTTCHRNFV